MVKILISSVGSLVGYNVLDVLEGRRENLQIIGTNSIESDSNIYRCDTAYMMPSTKTNRAAFMSRLEEIIEQENPDLLIPGRDDDLIILAALKAKDPKHANKYLCGSENAVKQIVDKWLTYTFAMRHNLPFARSAKANPETDHAEVKELLAEFGFPLLVKPRDGFGSHGVFVIANEDQLAKALELEHMLVQQYLSDPNELDILHSRIKNTGVPLFFSFEEEKYSIQTFVNQDGSVGDIFCTVHKMVSGRSLKVERVVDADLQDIGMRYAKAMAHEGWFGPLNIQTQKLQSGEYVGYELNGRFTGATSARLYLGFDEVGNTIHNLFGLRIESSTPLSKAKEVSRYVTTRAIPDDASIMLKDQGKWQSS